MACIKDMTMKEFSALAKDIVINGVKMYRGVDCSKDINADGDRMMNSFVDTVDAEWFLNAIQTNCILGNPEQFFTTKEEAEEVVKNAEKEIKKD